MDIQDHPLEFSDSRPARDKEVEKLSSRRTKTHLQRRISGSGLDTVTRSDLTPCETPIRIRRRVNKKRSKDPKAPLRMLSSPMKPIHNDRGGPRCRSSVSVRVNDNIDFYASDTSLRIRKLNDLPIVPVGSTEGSRYDSEQEHIIRGLELQRKKALQRGDSFKISSNIRALPRKQSQAKLSFGNAKLGASFPELEYWHNACASHTHELSRSSSATNLYQSPAMLSRQFVVAIPQDWESRRIARNESAPNLQKLRNKPRARKTSSSRCLSGNISVASLCQLSPPIKIKSFQRSSSSASLGQVGVSRRDSARCFEFKEESVNLSTEWQSFTGTCPGNLCWIRGNNQ